PRTWLRPSLTDLLLASLVAWLFVAGEGWKVLLADGDTGWHIRTGDYILQSGTIPSRDIFSFSRSGEPWFAWEWLSDVIFSLLHSHWGLAGVAALTGSVLALGALVVFGHMLWRGANPMVALATLLVAVSASAIHYLARPHIFTLLLLPLSLWMVERDLRKPSPAVWLLVPLSAVWVNLHGGFFALPACLVVMAAGHGTQQWIGRERRVPDWRGLRRLGALAAATAAASVANPYGFGLHRHVWSYLRSDWIRNAVDEFQSPKFRSENLLHFELLLVAALVLTGWLASRRRIADGLLVLVWAHLALGSVRHVPLFVLLTAPMVAAEASGLWERWASRRSARSLGRILWQSGQDLGAGFRRPSAWSALAVAGLLLATPAAKWPRDFPEATFPVALIRTSASHLSGARLFTSDQWGDYLIYRNWPGQKVFIDGRSDFYGPAVGGDYLRLVEGRPGWESLLDKYDFSAALVPRQWPLAALLEGDSGWSLAQQDRLASLFVRSGTQPGERANRIARLNR
ncbi:MAG TPA: hypothetical protein VLH09_15290, partial [Bryobacteraceae bacterium]|nr:hypothetical protein [Bryobacteraceae bacterium]